MFEWMAALAAAAVLALIVFLWSRSRSLEWRFRRIAGQVAGLQVNNTVRTRKVLRRVYALVHAGMAAADQNAAYRAVDLLKEAFGNGAAGADDPRLLSAVVIGGIRTKQLDIAAAALDAFRQMLRKLPADHVPAALEQLGFIAVVAFKERHGFLTAKVTDIFFAFLERRDWGNNPAAAAVAVDRLKIIGVLALRRKDAAMFREIAVRLLASLPPQQPPPEFAAALVTLTGVWLHRMVQNDDMAMFALLTDFVDGLRENGVFSQTAIMALVKEWQGLAGSASLNPQSELAPAISEFSLRLAFSFGDQKHWGEAIAAAGQVGRLSLQRHGIKRGFPMVMPLLECGRTLLTQELRFGSGEDPDSFRQRALYLLVRECMTLAEFTARQDIKLTAGDVIVDFFHEWTSGEQANPKTAKRFCQLLAAYWLRVRARQAKRVTLSAELAEPPLLSDADKQRLGFLL